MQSLQKRFPKLRNLRVLTALLGRAPGLGTKLQCQQRPNKTLQELSRIQVSPPPPPPLMLSPHAPPALCSSANLSLPDTTQCANYLHAAIRLQHDLLHHQSRACWKLHFPMRMTLLLALAWRLHQSWCKIVRLPLKRTYLVLLALLNCSSHAALLYLRTARCQS